MIMSTPAISLQTIVSALACLCPHGKEGYMQFDGGPKLAFTQNDINANRLQVIEESIQRFEQKLASIELAQARILTLLEASAGLAPREDIDVRNLPSESSCSKHQVSKSLVKGVRLEKSSFDVLCERSKVDNAVWLVIQRRFNGSENFYRNWNEYKNGFGSYFGEFFIGLEKLHQLTKSNNYELLVTLEDFDGNVRYAKYDEFLIGNEDELYKISKLGKYSGDAGDSFHRVSAFSTYDKDNDDDTKQNCAQEYKSGWWFGMCLESNLNGEYLGPRYPEGKFAHGIIWKLFKGYEYSLKAAEMALRVKSLI